MSRKFRDYDDDDFDYVDRKRRKFDSRKEQRRKKYDAYEDNWRTDER